MQSSREHSKTSQRTERRSPRTPNHHEVKDMLRLLFTKKKQAERNSPKTLPVRDFEEQLRDLQQKARDEIKRRLQARSSPSPPSTVCRSDEVQGLQEENQHLRRKLMNYEQQSNLLIEEGLRQQTEEMRSILSQYLTFIDKILADKKALIAENAQLKGELDHSPQDSCSKCDEIKGFYEGLISRLQKENDEEVVGLRSALHEKETQLQALRKIMALKIQ